MVILQCLRLIFNFTLILAAIAAIVSGSNVAVNRVALVILLSVALNNAIDSLGNIDNE